MDKKEIGQAVKETEFQKKWEDILEKPESPLEPTPKKVFRKWIKNKDLPLCEQSVIELLAVVINLCRAGNYIKLNRGADLFCPRYSTEELEELILKRVKMQKTRIKVYKNLSLYFFHSYE